jgi:TonB family protein
MTEARRFAEVQDRRRTLLSMGITIGLYSLLFVSGILYGLLNPEEIRIANTTVIVRLQGPEVPEPGLGSVTARAEGELKPEPAAAPKAAVAVPKVEQKAKVASPAKTVENTVPSPSPAPKAATSRPAPDSAEAPAAPNAVSAAQSLPEQATPPMPEIPWVPGERGPGSRISSTSSAVLVPGQGEIPWTQGNSTTIRRAEQGNSMDTTLGAASGTVGQSLHVPIYLSLPLPRELPAYLYDRITPKIEPPTTIIYTVQARQKAFSMYYELSGGMWRLKGDVPMAQRSPLWEILEDAGFNPTGADYKAGRSLFPVVIGFTVTKDKQLKGVEVLQSSGDTAIDAAILYGFKQAQFWNRTGDTVPGRFTYRF